MKMMIVVKSMKMPVMAAVAVGAALKMFVAQMAHLAKVAPAEATTAKAQSVATLEKGHPRVGAPGIRKESTRTRDRSQVYLL